MPSFVPFIIAGVVVLVIVAIVAGIIQDRKRREALMQWADRNGWRFSADRDPGLEGRFPQFDCLRQGSNRYAYNLVTGRRKDRGLTAFDYHYETHSTDSKGNRQTHHHHFSAVVLETPWNLPPLLIRTESIFDKMAGAFGWDDIDFESAEFSRRFYVKARDRRWAYDVLHPRAMQYLLDSPRYSIQFGGRQVLVWRASKFNVAEFEQALALGEGLLEQMPPYLVKQLESGQATLHGV